MVTRTQGKDFKSSKLTYSRFTFPHLREKPSAEFRRLTWLPGAPGEVAFNDLAGGVVSSTHATLIFLLLGSDHVVTAHFLDKKIQKNSW